MEKGLCGQQANQHLPTSHVTLPASEVLILVHWTSIFWNVSTSASEFRDTLLKQTSWSFLQGIAGKFCQYWYNGWSWNIIILYNLHRSIQPEGFRLSYHTQTCAIADTLSCNAIYKAPSQKSIQIFASLLLESVSILYFGDSKLRFL